MISSFFVRSTNESLKYSIHRYKLNCLDFMLITPKVSSL